MKEDFADALSILQNSPRPDVSIKFRYASQVIKRGEATPSTKDLYLRNIKSFNGFYEEQPRKRSARDFIQSFERLIASMSAEGWRANSERICVSSENRLISGAHRTAVAACLGLSVPITIGSEDPYQYGQHFFSARGMNSSDLLRSTNSYLAATPTARALIIHGNVPAEFDSTIDWALAPDLMQFAKFEARLNFNAYCNLKSICYGHWITEEVESWVGNKRNRYVGIQNHARASMGSNPTRLYIVNGSPDQLVGIKAMIRAKFPSLEHSAHSTESREETRELLHLIAHRKSRELASVRPFWDNFDLDQKLRNVSLMINDDQTIQDFCFAGSAPLGVYGIRAPADLDYLKISNLSELKLEPLAESHNDLQSLYGIDPDLLIEDPKFHIFYRGFKFASLEITRQMKINRAEYPKDYIDVVNIDNYLISYNKKSGRQIRLPLKLLLANYLIATRIKLIRSLTRSTFGSTLISILLKIKRMI